jgi:feruloyl esterase
MVDRRTGAGGKPYGIGFAVGLPDEWNGRLLMQGGGGLNGTVAPPVGPAAAGDVPALLRGFAVVSTDTGHQSTAAFDGSFFQDQQASLDFAFVAVGRVARLAKEIVAARYGRPPDRSYYTGCSTGGREGLVMAQRYPTYFDGIVAGAPAMRTGHSNLALRWNAVTLNQVAPRDDAGRPIPKQAFSDDERELVADALLAACDAKDGLADGMIFDTRGCAFDPTALACGEGKSEGCLSPAKAAAIARAFSGPKDTRGRQVYPGFPYDTGIGATGFIPGILAGGGPPGPPVLALEQDVDREARAADENAQALLTDAASWTNLSTFSGRGGRLLLYHGVSDPWFSAHDTLGWYERLGPANGGADAVRSWSRYFPVPGMGHCGGGPTALDQFDLLGAVVDWVEKGKAPDAVVATGKAFPGRSRPLCPDPLHAHYKGTGGTESAASFECRVSEPPPVPASVPTRVASPNDTLVSTEIAPDRKVTFRLYAPKAAEVRLRGDWMEGPGTEALKRDQQGVWSATVGPLAPDLHNYWFVVDEVKTVDPRNPLVKQGIGSVDNLIFVSGKEAALLEARPVPHGEVRIAWYPSTTLGVERRLHVYTPPGYERGKDRYPVLYLLHGGGDEDSGWSTIGRAGFILDNLLAEGKALPMLVVMPNGSLPRPANLPAVAPGTTPSPEVAAALAASPARFTSELMKDVLPFVERTWRARPEARSRAIAGLSMGGGQTQRVVTAHPDAIGWVAVWSAGVRPGDTEAFERDAAAFLGAPQKVNRSIRLLSLRAGEKDFALPGTRNLSEVLKRHGIEHTLEVNGGGHTWLNWRLYLAELLPKLFR